MKETHLEKAVKAFLKDEYNLTDVDVTIKLSSVTAKKEDITRLNHDATNDFDFDLID
jgi:hypothetical protein